MRFSKLLRVDRIDKQDGLSGIPSMEQEKSTCCMHALPARRHYRMSFIKTVKMLQYVLTTADSLPLATHKISVHAGEFFMSKLYQVLPRLKTLKPSI